MCCCLPKDLAATSSRRSSSVPLRTTTALSLNKEDRQRILDVLEQPSIGLAQLQTVLKSQLEKYAERQRRTERIRHGREAFERA